MGNFNTEISNFSLEGQFVGFVGDFEEQPKRIKVATVEGDRYIKLSKQLRGELRGVLQAGDWLQVSGELKRKYKTDEVKLKAYQVKLMVPAKREPVVQPPAAAGRTKACVMVCQKSSCQKRGAGEVGQAVTKLLRDRGLEDQVAIKGTGCMKECKKGPCVVFMPDKSRYTGVSPNEIPTLIEKHFAAKLRPEQSKPELSPVS